MEIQLGPDEQLVLKVRRHVFPFITRTAFLLVFVIFPPVIFGVMASVGLSNFNGSGYLFLFIYSLILFFTATSFFIALTDYYLNILVVTNERLIDIGFKGFFNREVSTLRLDRIEDITIKVNGILANLLKYGDLSIQTAAETDEFLIKNVPNPEEVKNSIYQLYNEHVKNQNG